MSERDAHREIIGIMLAEIQKQKEITQKLNRDLEFFRKKFNDNLVHDNGDGEYGADMGDQMIDLREVQSWLGDGSITKETASDYLGYQKSMENFQLGLQKSKGDI